jgi:hypothetical protein
MSAYTRLLIRAFGIPVKRQKRRARRALRKARFALALELQRAMRGPFLPIEQVWRELALDEAPPGSAGQSAALCGAKEGRSTDVASL